jgi:hypothetical protein
MRGGPSKLRVRPYLLTGGRTTSDVELLLETVLRTTQRGEAELAELNLEPEKIVRLCCEPMSIVELAARLDLPLQVARVLVGDLVTQGLVGAELAGGSAGHPDLSLLERVLDGLQNL